MNLLITDEVKENDKKAILQGLLEFTLEEYPVTGKRYYFTKTI